MFGLNPLSLAAWKRPLACQRDEWQASDSSIDVFTRLLTTGIEDLSGDALSKGHALLVSCPASATALSRAESFTCCDNCNKSSNKVRSLASCLTTD